MPMPFTPGLCASHHLYSVRGVWGQGALGVGMGGRLLVVIWGKAMSWVPCAALEEALLLIFLLIWGTVPGLCCDASLTGAVSATLCPFWSLHLALLELGTDEMFLAGICVAWGEQGLYTCLLVPFGNEGQSGGGCTIWPCCIALRS